MLSIVPITPAHDAPATSSCVPTLPHRSHEFVCRWWRVRCIGVAAREGAGERAGDVMRVAKPADHAAKH